MIHTICLYCKSTFWDPIHHAMVAMGNIIQHFRMHKTHVLKTKSVPWSRGYISAMGDTKNAKVRLQRHIRGRGLVHGPKVNCEYNGGRIAFSKFRFKWCNFLQYINLIIENIDAYVSVSSNRLPIKYLAITCVALFILVITCCIGIWKR